MINNRLLEHILRTVPRIREEAVWLDVQNVADYYLESDQEEWAPSKDFPNMAPPWPRFVATYHHPGFWNSLGKRMTGDAADVVVIGQWAPLTGHMPSDCRDGAQWVLRLETLGYPTRLKIIFYGMQFIFVAADGRWIPPSKKWQDALLTAYHLNGGQGDTTPLRDDSRVHWRTTYGQVLDENFNPITLRAPFRADPSLCEKLSEEIATNVSSWSNPALLAICFTHCRNVEVQESRPNRAERRRIERNGEPGPCWRVLDIHPMRKVLDATKQGEARGSLPKALHICRGHFADYTEGRGLFGRLHGTYWIPMHARGKADAGVVTGPVRINPD